MQAVTGVFLDRADAEHAVETLRAAGVPDSRITLLTPGYQQRLSTERVSDEAEQPGMGTAVGAVVGGAAGLSGGSLLLAAAIPGVGIVTAAGLLGAAILGAAGAAVGAVAGQSLEDSMARGLPEDEIFVYEDALRKGRTVVIVLAEELGSTDQLRALMIKQGAETVDDAREQWWIGLRSAEDEHYSRSGRKFRDDERFYRMGFEAALHARTRGKEFDQVSAEMESRMEELKQQYPDTEVAEPFTRGYQRGREYYQSMVDRSKAA
jgi:hypothetical protein